MKTFLKFLVFNLLLTGLFVVVQPAFAAVDYQAQKTEQSYAGIPELNPTQTFEFWVKFKNTGQEAWSGSGTEAVILRTVSGMKSKLTHSSWYADYIPNRVNPVSTIYPGAEALFRFTLLGPRQNGLYWEKFQLYAGSTPIPGGEIEIAVKITGATTEKPSVPEPAPTPTPAPAPTPTPAPTTPAPTGETIWWQSILAETKIIDNPRWTNVPSGPEIKVGLLYVEKTEKKDNLPFKISALNSQLYNVFDKNDNLLVKNTAGEIIEIDYDYQLNRYFLNDSQGKRLLMSDSYFKISGNDPAIFKINSWKNGPFWGENVNDNEFRGKLEIQYNPSTGRLWLINQLPLEDYVKSVAEVGDLSHPEFLKAQIIAARTYALFRLLTPKYTNTPDNKPLFAVQATQADQVYRGYQRELRASNTVLAAEQTKGIIASYRNDPILAYYFAQSDGQTRASYLVNMTKDPVDYLIAKADPPCQGKELKGHGVGLSQIGGINAARQGANYSQILKYYYTGIDLTKVY